MNATNTKDVRKDAITLSLNTFDIRFSSQRGWDTLVEHVDEHRKLLKSALNVDAQWHEAVFSWYENVFTPVYRVVSQWSFRHSFPHQPLGDLYLAVSDHWGYMKERDPNISVTIAARDFLKHYGSGINRYFSRFLVPRTF